MFRFAPPNSSPKNQLPQPRCRLPLVALFFFYYSERPDTACEQGVGVPSAFIGHLPVSLDYEVLVDQPQAPSIPRLQW